MRRWIHAWCAHTHGGRASASRSCVSLPRLLHSLSRRAWGGWPGACVYACARQIEYICTARPSSGARSGGAAHAEREEAQHNTHLHGIGWVRRVLVAVLRDEKHRCRRGKCSLDAVGCESKCRGRRDRRERRPCRRTPGATHRHLALGTHTQVSLPRDAERQSRGDRTRYVTAIKGACPKL